MLLELGALATTPARRVRHLRFQLAIILLLFCLGDLLGMETSEGARRQE